MACPVGRSTRCTSTTLRQPRFQSDGFVQFCLDRGYASLSSLPQIERSEYGGQCADTDQQDGRSAQTSSRLIPLRRRFERRVVLNSRPAQSLLAYLLLHAVQAHRREKQASLLWPDSSEENAYSNLRHVLWRLRTAIPDGYVEADRITIAWTDSR
jgi:hypothetical protein